MKAHFCRLIATFFVSVGFANAEAQRAAPHISFAYPAGAQRNTTVTVSVCGQNLNGVTAVCSSDPALHAKITGYSRPLTQKELSELRDEAQRLREKRAASQSAVANTEGTGGAGSPVWTAADEKREEEVRRVIIARRPNRASSPAIAETVTLEITLPPDAVPGERELRLKAPHGLSNPVTFFVGELPEFSDPVVTATSELIPGPNRRGDPRTAARPKPSAREIKLPATVNGQILPGEVDRFRFSARKGQRITIAVSARALIPYLADAVPGWFQATLALYDPKGREVAYGDDFRFNPDPVLACTIPADGDYTVEIKDSIYRGREDFVYRISIGELPFITGLFPLGSAPRTRTRVEVQGWNLPASHALMDAKEHGPDVLLLTLCGGEHASNPVPFRIEGSAARFEAEPNDDTGTAQKLTLPQMIDGRIDDLDDCDVFRFEGRKGEEIVAEVFARRLDSPLDSILEFTDAAGQSLVRNDDYEDKGSGLTTHHADSRVSLRLPADGTYFVRVTDAQHHSGQDYAYRLHIGPPRPDFELRVTPSSINARAGTHVPFTVYALRRDGFGGEIALGLHNAPPGFHLSGARIPAGQDKVRLTLFAPPLLRDDPAPLTLVGTATIGNRSVIHVAIPAEDMMQAFAYHHLVPARELLVNVSGRGGSCRLLSRTPLKIPTGGTASLKIALPPAARDRDAVLFELSEPPDGISVQKTVIRDGVAEVVFVADAAKAQAGLQGNLIATFTGERMNAGPQKKQARGQRVPLSSAPAIPFEVIAANR
ncbi:MAG TPA: PPC domain-containing protein [Opitutaceae bacterium]